MENTITKRFSWEMGHIIPDGLCNNLHGHSYSALVTVAGGIPDNGTVLDCGIVKAKLLDIFEALDHGYMVWEQDLVCDKLLAIGGKILVMPFIPTAENIARHILEEAQKLLAPLQVVKVRVYETTYHYVDAAK